MKVEEVIARRMNKARDLGDLAQLLERFLSECEIEDNAREPRLIFKRALVARINGLRIEIFANEHTPPHFHVSANDIDASFSISDCELLKGSISRKDQRLITFWHSGAKNKLIEFWNHTRPLNCPVGRIEEG
jgi:hypothetical protein